MEFFFSENLRYGLPEVILEGEEFRHFKALRLNKQDVVAIVDGRGLSAIGYIKSFDKGKAIVKVNNYVENLGESEKEIALALGILENKERFEFAFEKAIELRINRLYPVISRYTQPKDLDLKRLWKKGIAALKQARRSRLPTINTAIQFSELSKLFKNWELVLMADSGGKNILTFDLRDYSNILVVVGPEGGFEPKEINTAKKQKNVEIISLGNYRLRSETSVVSILSILNLLLQ